MELLPALPTEWREGQVRGLRSRCGVEVEMRWEAAALTSAVVLSRHPHPLLPLPRLSLPTLLPCMSFTARGKGERAGEGGR